MLNTLLTLFKLFRNTALFKSNHGCYKVVVFKLAFFLESQVIGDKLMLINHSLKRAKVEIVKYSLC